MLFACGSFIVPYATHYIIRSTQRWRTKNKKKGTKPLAFHPLEYLARLLNSMRNSVHRNVFSLPPVLFSQLTIFSLSFRSDLRQAYIYVMKKSDKTAHHISDYLCVYLVLIYVCMCLCTNWFDCI